MGKLWGKDAVSRDAFTTPLSIITALDESPVQAGLLAVGTDDGLIQISENNGQTWRTIEHVPGVPPGTYVSDVFFSPRDRSTLYVTFNNWQYGDFRPYVFQTVDLGRSWRSITGNLPDRHVVWSIVADRVHAGLLFVGTEFGLFVTLDGGEHWLRVPGRRRFHSVIWLFRNVRMIWCVPRSVGGFTFWITIQACVVGRPKPQAPAALLLPNS
jgi:photosystem II stability/assembly factor-like uncharacterized protein